MLTTDKIFLNKYLIKHHKQLKLHHCICIIETPSQYKHLNLCLHTFNLICNLLVHFIVMFSVKCILSPSTPLSTHNSTNQSSDLSMGPRSLSTRALPWELFSAFCLFHSGFYLPTSSSSVPRTPFSAIAFSVPGEPFGGKLKGFWKLDYICQNSPVHTLIEASIKPRQLLAAMAQIQCQY